jgi:hypothetical protein
MIAKKKSIAMMKKSGINGKPTEPRRSGTPQRMKISQKMGYWE